MIAQKQIAPQTKELNDEISRTIQNVKSVLSISKTCLPTIEGNIFMRITEISHFKSEDIYCRLYTRDGDIHFITKPLKWVEHKLFKYGFYRIHKSFFINILNIQKYHQGDGGYLIMDCGQTVPISRSKKTQLQKLLEEL